MVYTPHSWIASTKSKTYIADAVRAIGAAGFNQQLHNLGRLDASGAVPTSDYAGLAQWVTGSRQTDPSQGIIVWISGSESEHVNNRSLHPSIASGLRELVETYGVDGILLDLEPFSKDNADYLHLMAAIRLELPSAWIGVTAPPDGRWTNRFIGEMASKADALTPMFYDTSLTTAAAYSELVGRESTRYTAATNGNAAVLPSLPSYGANAWHDPTIENIANAVAGLQTMTGARAGAAVYWWHEFDDIARRQWREAIEASSAAD